MKRFDNINVVPLIDVMLVLLAVVLVTASFIVHDALKLDLPDTTSTSEYSPPEQETRSFAIDANGQLYIDDQPITFSELTQQASLISIDTHLVIKVDESAKFGAFVKLVDILKANQLTNLTFLTEKASAPSSQEVSE